MKEKIVLDSISKVFSDGNQQIQVLDEVSLNVHSGELVAVVGPSGSGKSTFLSIAGALLSPTNGRIKVGETDITNLSPTKLNEIRLEKIGFVFQSANLIPYLNVEDQLMLVPRLAKRSRRKEDSKIANRLIERLGLNSRKGTFPEHLSGGERQRVAIARAMMNDPEIILADEPTASLDSERGRTVVEMLNKEVKLRDKAAIMVTHDKRMLDLCDRVVYIEDGKLTKEIV